MSLGGSEELPGLSGGKDRATVCYTPRTDSRRAIPSQFHAHFYPSVREARHRVGWGSLVTAGTCLGDWAAASWGRRQECARVGINEKTALISDGIHLEVESLITGITASHCGSPLGRGKGKKFDSVSRPPESKKS